MARTRGAWRDGSLALLGAGIVAILMLGGCGGGGGDGGGAAPTTREPLPTLSQDSFPSGARIDVASRDFHPATLGDRTTFQSIDRFGRPVSVQREVTSGPDAQGRYTVVETVPAQPALPALSSTFRRTAAGIVAIDYRSSDRLPGPPVPLGDFLLYPTPFYPAGATRTAVRQGSLGADADGDGVHDSFRFEFSQVFVGFENGQRGGRLEVRARFRQRITITIQPSRLDRQTYTLSDLSEEVVFGAHTGLILSDRSDRMGSADVGRDYDDLTLVGGSVGGRSIDTAWNAGSTRYIPLGVRSLAYEPVRGFYYAGLGLEDAANPGSVVRIDPATGAVDHSVALGGDVRSIDVSGDGASLYAAIAGRNEVVRLSLPDLQVRQRIGLPAGSSAYALAVSPVDAATFAWYGEGTANGPYLVRAGVRQARSPGGSVVPAASSGAMAFSADGTQLLMIGGTPAGRALLRMAVLPDGISGSVASAADPVFGNALTPMSGNVLAGNSLFRVSDLSRSVGASGAEAVGCAPLRESTRWACRAGASGAFVVSVIDSAASYGLIEDGNVPLVQPLPAGASTLARTVPGPAGQVAVILTSTASPLGAWVALFDNPDFR